MKKFLLFALLVNTFYCASAQWQNDGTRYSNVINVYNHKSVLSATDKGGAYLVWQTDTTVVVDSAYKTATWFTLQAITDSGKVRAGWPAGGIRLIAPNLYAGGCRVITSEDGGAIVSWFANTDSPQIAQIYIQKFDSFGTVQWNNGQPVQVSPSTLNVCIYPVIVSDGRNGAYLAWNRADVNNDFSTGDIVMQHINNLGRRDVLWNPEGAVVAATDSPEYYPQISVTHDNSIYVVYGMGYFNSNEQLVLKKMNAETGGFANGWSKDGVTITAPWVDFIQPYAGLNLFTDKQDNAMMFWLDGHSSGLNYAVFMQLVSPAGQTLLPASGPYPPEGVHLLSDNVYEYSQDEGGGGTGAIFMQAVQDVANDDYFVSFNVVTPDTGEYDLSLINIDASGNVIWQDTLLTTNGISGYSQPVIDGNGGVFVFYDSLATAQYYLNVIGVNKQGHIDSAWTAYGPSFGAADVYDYSSPLDDLFAVYTRKGEAMATWQRFHNTIEGQDTIGSYDIYACNLLSTGQTCTTNPAYPDTAKTSAINPINGAVESLEVFPNPFSNQATVYFSTTGEYHDLNFKIYNLSGQLVQEAKITPYADNSISTAGLAGGLYVYQLIGDNTVVRNGKIVKQ